MSHTAALSAYFKDTSNKLHKLSTTIGIDPEGVTEQDVSIVWLEVIKSLKATQAPYQNPVLIAITGGKA